MRIEFLPWDDRLAVLRFINDAWGPVTEGFPLDISAVNALYVADPQLLEAYRYVEGIVVKIVHKEPLSPVERKIVKRALRLRVPREYLATVEEKYEQLQRDFPSVRKALEEVVSKAHGERVLQDPIFVFPSFKVSRGTEGSAYGDDVVGMAFNIFSRGGIGTRVLVHELLHIFLNRDSEFKSFINELREKYSLPLHEAHVEALTNLVWWRAGRAKKMFERHYDPSWKDLVKFEEKYWNVVERWWKEEGNLREQVEKAFGNAPHRGP